MVALYHGRYLVELEREQRGAKVHTSGYPNLRGRTEGPRDTGGAPGREEKRGAASERGSGIRELVRLVPKSSAADEPRMFKVVAAAGDARDGSL